MQISTPAKPLPDSIADEAALEELLSRPTPYVIDALAKIDGDLLILGVAGKMGRRRQRRHGTFSSCAEVHQSS